MSIIGEAPDNAVSMNTIDHHKFDHLLYKYVDENGDVDYTSWKANDGAKLKEYLESLSAADPDKKASDEAKLAFWINAYNALTIHGILEKYPTSSIRNHTAKVFGYNIWHDLKLQVADDSYSLDTIEHKILRNMQEPNIHFAIVCASHSCPRLLNEAYTAEKLDEQLITNSEFFFANSENYQISADKQIIYLSSILKWFSEDFGTSKSEVIEQIAELTPEDSQEILEQSNGPWKVKYLPYSWKLNDQKTAKKRRK